MSQAATLERADAASPREQGLIEGAAQAIATSRGTWRHATTEFRSDLTAIMQTIRKDGPLAYALPDAPTGPVTVVNSFPAIEAYYAENYRVRKILDWTTRFELRTPFYTFFDGVVRRQDLLDGSPPVDEQNIVLFPMGDGDLILGEMPWTRFPEMGVGAAEKLPRIPAPVCDRRLSRELFDSYLEALRSNSAAAAAAGFLPGAKVATRDYARRQPAMVGGPVTTFFTDLFAAFEVQAVDFVHLLAEDWYVFAELQWTVRERASGARSRFNTVDFFPLAQGRFVARVGYGTGLAPA